jgi:GMP synthase (glutamine-hydrolysing)
MKIHTLQHDAAEGPGHIEPWARGRGHTLSATQLFNDEPLPSPEDFDWLVVMGGPMNVYQTAEFPWLTREKRFIEAALHAKKTVVGMCLGAQLLADVLGARVRRNEHAEIGWFPVQLTPDGQRSTLLSSLPAEFTVLHWHGDTFELPRGATHLARSEACANQAFTYGPRALGLQFHLEFSSQSVRALLQEDEQLGSGPYIQTAHELLTHDERFVQSNRMLDGILDRLVESSA